MTEAAGSIGTLALVAAIVARHAGIGPDRVTTDAKLGEDLRIDSLRLVELAVDAEDQFGILIPDAAAERFETVGDVVRFLDQAGAGARSSHQP